LATVLVAPVRVVDAPAVRWRVITAQFDGLGATAEERQAALLALPRRVHALGANALAVDVPADVAPEARARFEVEARRRHIALLGADDAPVRLGDAARWQTMSAAGRRGLAAALEDRDSLLLLDTDPFAGASPEAPLAADLLGPDVAATERRLARFLVPLPPPASEGNARFVGRLHGMRLGRDTGPAAHPVAWVGALQGEPPALVAACAWHGGTRGDALGGRAELQRVLDALTR
jgi:hypothetical protein